MNQNIRTQILIGKEALDRLWSSSVAIFGVGGVGGNAVEALARAGIGHIDLIDADEVSFSNLNRQLIATRETVGKDKVEVMKERLLSINPGIEVKTYKKFYLPENSHEFDFSRWDYVIDAIDTVAAKIDIIQKAKELNIPVISAMGCGNRLDPTKLVVTDLFKTSGDPLAKVMRHELRKRGIDSLTVVCSTEPPLKPDLSQLEEELPIGKKSIPGSTPFVPCCAGIILASKVVSDLIKNK